MDEGLEQRIAEAREAHAKQFEEIKEIETSMLQFEQDLKYPLTPPNHRGDNSVLLMNYLPDLPATLAYHFIRCGWRKIPEKQMVKQRPVVNGMFEDLVAYVGMDEPDDPIVVERPETPEPAADVWSVKPKVNMIDEERPA